ncbi:hypothetical protein P7H12_13775 [Paenibacillus larvae]|nr:hypothetical protein [Paenibacillus larvae]
MNKAENKINNILAKVRAPDIFLGTISCLLNLRIKFNRYKGIVDHNTKDHGKEIDGIVFKISLHVT